MGDAGGLTVAGSPLDGLGVFATGPFAEGATLLLLDDSRVVDAAHPLRPAAGEIERHCDYLAGGVTILMPPPGCYINSSCDPNTVVRSVEGVRRVVALRAIAAGEEITFDYLLNCHGGVAWACRCGTSRCRGQVPPSFFDLPRNEQVRLLPLLDIWFVEEHRGRVEALLGHGGRPLAMTPGD